MPWQPLPDRSDPDPTVVGSSLDRLVRFLGGASVDSMTSLFDRWEDFVGDTMAAHCRPISLRAGVLTVGVDDPAWSTEIRFLETTLIERLNRELGESAVGSIEVRVRPRTGGNA